MFSGLVIVIGMVLSIAIIGLVGTRRAVVTRAK